VYIHLVGVYFLPLPTGSLAQPGKRAREDEGRRQKEKEREGERFAGPVGLFDFTCSYVIEYYTRLPRWKGWKLLQEGRAWEPRIQMVDER